MKTPPMALLDAMERALRSALVAVDARTWVDEAGLPPQKEPIFYRSPLTALCRADGTLNDAAIRAFAITIANRLELVSKQCSRVRFYPLPVHSDDRKDYWRVLTKPTGILVLDWDEAKLCDRVGVGFQMEMDKLVRLSK